MPGGGAPGRREGRERGGVDRNRRYERRGWSDGRRGRSDRRGRGVKGGVMGGGGGGGEWEEGWEEGEGR